jgi:hypothetical protein
LFAVHYPVSGKYFPVHLSSGIMRTTPQSGMNIFELMWFVFIVSGAIVGGRFGYTHFGAWGAVLGVPFGGAVGFLTAATAAFLLALIFKALFGGTLFAQRNSKKNKP